MHSRLVHKDHKTEEKNLNAKKSSKLQKCLGVSQFSYMLFSQKPQSQTVWHAATIHQIGMKKSTKLI